MLLYILDLLGVAVFAATGVLAAGRKKLDLFGIVVVAIVTSVGGGTLRDLILGIRPVFWIAHPIYVLVAVVSALVTFVTVGPMRRVMPVRLANSIMLVLDAVGLAFFTVLGCQRTIDVHAAYTIVVLMGVITGVAGGIIRDLLCSEIPLVLRREVYATASLIGGIVFVVMHYLGVREGIIAISAASATLIVRLAAIKWQLSLPVLSVDE